MFRPILTIININASQRLNAILYYIKKIPLIKGRLKNTNYSFLGFKKFLSVAAVIYNIISAPIIFGLFFLAGIFLPVTGYLPTTNPLSGIMFFIFSFFFLYQLLGSELMEANRETFIVVKQMKMDPKVYSISQTIWKKTRGLYSKALIFALVFKFGLNQDPIGGVKIALAITMFTIFMEAIHLYIFKKTGFIVNKLKNTRIALIFAGMVGTYAIVSFTKIPEFLNLFNLLTNTYLVLAMSLLGIVGFIYLLTYDCYWDILNEENKSEVFKELQEVRKTASFQGAKLKEKDFDERALRENDLSDKEGYDYLNYIFFKRHRRKIYKPMVLKSLIVVGVFLALFVADKFFIDGFAKDMGGQFLDNFTLFVFVVYILCNSTSIMKSLFYNCDRSLLRYGFYKESGAIVKMFFLRLRKILLSNMVPVVLLCVGILQMIYFNLPERLNETILLIIAILVLGLLFTVHYIFLYYILQPFTSDLKTKNPLYNIINVLVYLVSYSLILVGGSAIKSFPYILGFSLIYIVMAIGLVYKKAPKTFRVK